MLKIKRFSRVSSRLYQFNLLLVIVILLSTGIINRTYSVFIKQRDMDTTILNMASMISQLEEVRTSLMEKKVNLRIQEEMDILVRSFEQVDILVVCDKEGILYYHNSPERIGLHFQGGDEEKILNGSEPYISVAEGTLGKQRRAFACIRDENGAVLGFAMASVLTDSLDRIRLAINGTFLILFIVFVLFGSLLSAQSVYYIRKILIGYQPEEFLNLYVERAEVLDALEEGIIVIDKKGDILLMNRQAKNIMNLSAAVQTEGKPLTEFYPSSQLKNTAESGIPEMDFSICIGGNNILASRIPVRTGEEIIGAVAVFRNKTEVTKLAEELTGARYMVDTLRAFNHEFMNKLHVILGLLETENVGLAKEYITKTSMVSGEAVSHISRRVPSPGLAALLIGKLIRASELGITLVLKPDSYFKPKTAVFPDDCFITIIGNLLENAIYELNSSDFPVKKIELGIYSEEKLTIIVCDDTGGGISDEILSSIFEKDVTTKGNGHGNGMGLIKETIDRYQGTISIDTDPGEGTSIEIVIPF